MNKIKKANKHIGSDFNYFLEEEGIREEVEFAVHKRMIAEQIQAEMELKKITKKALAAKLGTSRAQLDRILDATNNSITLKSILKIAEIFGKDLRIQFV